MHLLRSTHVLARLAPGVQAALAHSIPLKKAECCLPSMTVWGRISTLNGRDYIIAQSTPNPRVEGGKAVAGTLYFMTQDGVTWADLPGASATHRDLAANMRDMLQGDPTHKHFWPPKPAEDDEPAAEDDAAPRPQHKEVTELQRLRSMIEDIADATTLAPVGAHVVNADDCIITNPLFPGLEYPDKLEAYYHQHRGPGSAHPSPHRNALPPLIFCSPLQPPQGGECCSCDAPSLLLLRSTPHAAIHKLSRMQAQARRRTCAAAGPSATTR